MKRYIKLTALMLAIILFATLLPRIPMLSANAANAPYVTLSPANTWTNEKLTITWSGIVADASGIKEIQYYRYSGSNGWAWAAIPNTAGKSSGSATIDTSLWENKDFGISLRAMGVNNKAGAICTSGDRYKKDKPIVTLSPANTWTNENLTIVWGGIVADTSGIKEIQYYRYSGSTGWAWVSIPNTAGKSSGSATIDTSFWENKEYGISLRAIGVNKKVGAAYASADRYKKDKPIVKLSPANTWTTENLTITWSGIVADASGIKEIQYYRYSGPNGWAWAAIPNTAGKSSGSATIDTSYWENKDFGITLRAIGTNNKVGSMYTSGDRYKRDISPDIKEIRNRLQSGSLFSTTADPTDAVKTLNSNGTYSVNYTLGSSLELVLNKIKTMVQAYMSPGNKYYQNASLKDSIDRALRDWANKNYQNTNWWYNQIFVPARMTDLLMYNLPEADYTKKLVDIARRGLPEKDRSGNNTGANHTDKLITALRLGVATNNTGILQDVRDQLENELNIYMSGQEGIMPDGTFQQHGALLYSGSYGVVFVNGVNSLLGYLNGTEFMVSDRAVNTYADFILNGLQYIFRGDTFDFGTSGRAISRENAIRNTVQTCVKNAVDVLLSIPGTDRKAELQALNDMRLSGTDNPGNMVKHFWTSDFTVVQRPDYYISVRGASTRMKKAEFMNGENSKGYFLADGATEILRDGSEYMNIFPVWDWSKIPGVTAVQVSGSSFPATDNDEKGGSPFVGGVSDGNNAVTAVTLHNTKPATALDARKAYFNFSAGLMALGNGITSKLSAEVVTSLNQTLLKGDVIYSDGTIETMAPNTTNAVPNVSWVLHNGMGYIFSVPQTVTISNKTQTGKWSDINTDQSTKIVSADVFGLYQSHGKTPTNAGYSYTVLPNTTQNDIQAYVSAPGMVEVANSSTVSAVWSNDDQALGVVFWNSGAVTVDASVTGMAKDLTVSANRPCVLLITGANDVWTVSAANPANEAMNLNLTVNRNWNGYGAAYTDGVTAITINLPDGILAGSTGSLMFEDIADELQSSDDFMIAMDEVE